MCGVSFGSKDVLFPFPLFLDFARCFLIRAFLSVFYVLKDNLFGRVSYRSFLCVSSGFGGFLLLLLVNGNVVSVSKTLKRTPFGGFHVPKHL